jgi:hypothetical protein
MSIPNSAQTKEGSLGMESGRILPVEDQSVVRKITGYIASVFIAMQFHHSLMTIMVMEILEQGGVSATLTSILFQ